jgi:hypothetical protein
MSDDSRKIRFGLWYDFRNPAQWPQPSDRLYREILDQIAWGENNGFDDVWLSEHHFIEDGYLPSILPAAAAIAARTSRIRIVSGVLLTPFHNPVRLAEDIATVDVISGGRFDLDAGVGFKTGRVRRLWCAFQGARRQNQPIARDHSPRPCWRERDLQERVLRFPKHQGAAGADPETSSADLAGRLHAGGAAPCRTPWRWIHRAGGEPRRV